MKKLIYLFLTVLIVACSGEDGNNSNDTNDGDNNQSSCPIYLDSNGVTIKACDDANFGDTGVINGVTYTVVDEAMLREMVANEEDVTKVVTTKVTDMNSMFYINSGTFSNFNQDIGSWDVSNVTDMGNMFDNASAFNQPIGGWDVSNVNGMGLMFRDAISFNQPIGGWDVSGVNDMVLMFSDATSFNQDLSSWVVDGVIDCNWFSEGATSWTLPQPNFTNCNPN